MRNISGIAKRVVAFLALTTIVACNNSDDINEIFIGHEWRLTYIEDGNTRRWPGQEKAYSLTFGANRFKAATPNGGKITGRWSADGKTRSFRCTDIITEGIGANDTIARLMKQILDEASSYNGDLHWLQIRTEKNHFMQFYNR